MRKLLVCLVPWMVMTAAWAESLAPASVAYTFSDTSLVGALRDDDECWLPTSATGALGWRTKSDGDLIDLDAEGRLVKVPTRLVAGKRYFSLSEAARQIGAVTAWEDGTFRMLGQVRSIDFIGSSLRVDSTLSFKVKLDRLENPNRLVIDLIGVAVPATNRFRFPQGVRFGQFKPDTLRLVIDDPNVGLPRTSRPGALRFLDLSLSPYKFAETVIVEPPFSSDGSPQSSQNTLGSNDLGQSSNSAAILQPIPAASVDLISSNIRDLNARAEALDLRVSAPARPQPIVAYETGTLITVTMSAKLQSTLALEKLSGKFVESVSSKALGNNQIQLRIRTKRPVTFEFGASGTTITLKLQQPKNSDGTLAGKTIVVDAGHGGGDSGATWPMSGKSPQVMEKNLTLSIARLLSAELTEQGASVIMTRNTDVRIPLKDRSEIANKNAAAMFVSIHINSSSVSDKQSGTMSFYHMRDTDCMLLARCIQDEMAKVNDLPNKGTVSDSRIYSTGFAVLRYAEVPAVLLELGFINHSRDRGAMTQSAWQQRIAAAIAKGIKVYLGDVKETPKP